MGLPYLPQFSDKQLFELVNLTMPAWLLLALFPRQKWAHNIATVVALFFSALYVALIANIILSGHKIDFAAMGTYDGVATLFRDTTATLPAWVHYIAFDLWTGLWLTSDAVSRGVPQLLMIPCQFLTLMLGPTGLLAYFILLRPFFRGAAASGGKAKTA